MMPLPDTWEENDDPTLEECYEYDEPEYDPTLEDQQDQQEQLDQGKYNIWILIL